MKASFSDFQGKGITKERKSDTHSHTHKEERASEQLPHRFHSSILV